MNETLNQQLLDRLLNDAKVDRGQYEQVFRHAQRQGMRVEEALIELGLFDELGLLKYLAALYRIRFVSSAKLSRLQVDRPTLELLPRVQAEQLQVFPINFHSRESTLVFVHSDPEDTDLSKRVAVAAGVVHTTPYLARPAAIRAAILKHYAGDIHAFAMIDRGGFETFGMLDTYERNLFTEESITSSSQSGTGSSEPVVSPSNAPPATGSGPPGRSSGVPRAVSESREEREDTDLDPLPEESTQQVQQGSLLDAVSASRTRTIEIANVLVSLLENQRALLRGHSAQVSRLLQRVSHHMGLDKAEIDAMRLAGLLHDLGKSTSYHLTALNVAEYDGHRSHALKCFQSPSRLFEGAALFPTTILTLNHLYERFDGSGFPDRRSGKDIPLGARLLAISETYADMVSNERNPFRKRLSARAAMEVLGRYRHSIFDPNLVDLFRVTVLGEHVQSQLLNQRPSVLLVDEDPEEATVLELRLAERGYEVTVCRSAAEALQQFTQIGADALITEVDLEPEDGFSLVESVRKQPGGTDLPVLFLTRRGDRESMERGLSLGAADYLLKPASAELVVAKAGNLLQLNGQRSNSRGIQGSLQEMGLPDVLQVLSRTRKSGQLRIVSGEQSGEIHFGEGAILNAIYGELKGEEALYRLLSLEEGQFSLDPDFRSEGRQIHETTEHLLLEAMRRVDEGAHPLH